MEIENLEGMAAILVTPFTEDGAIDERGLKHMVGAALEKGLDAVVVLGSNAEFPCLDLDEKVRVMGAAAEAAGGRIPVVGTASAWGTDRAVELAQEAQRAGCDAVMAALPLYFDLPFGEAVSHIKAVAEKGGLPVYYYHFPGVTGLSAAPEDLARMAQIDGVIGAKITVINRPFLKRTIRATRPFNWKVFTGTTLLFHDCLEFGGAGVFCPLPLIGTKDVKALYQAFKAGKRGEAKKIQNKLLRAIPIFTGSSLSPALLAAGFKAMVRMPYRADKRPAATHGLVKEALRLQSHPITSEVRRPYRPAGPEQKELVRKTLQNLGWL